MARGILGRSRTNRQVETISQPVLKYSDALPRKDLRDVENGISYSRPIHQEHWITQRPQTSDGRHSKKKTEVPAPGFDFRINVPPDEAVRLSVGTDSGRNGTMVGIALGSPRLMEAQSMMAQMQQMPPPPPVPDVGSPPSLKRKPSKWKKIGGLFRAKSALSANSNKPFYQVQAGSEWPLQGSSHSIDYKSQYKTDLQTNPIEHTEVWPCLETEADAHKHNGERHATQERKPGQGLLEVEIPTVEMERYSVMFGGLLQKSQPSQLNRRSKTLDDMSSGSKEPTTSTGPSRRRATSPIRSKSPSSSFTLFPALQTPKHPDPLPKQLPVSAPAQDSSSGVKSQTMLIVKGRPKGHQTQESVSSFLSSTTVSSVDESFLIHKLEPVRTYIDAREPKWEIVNRKSPATKTEPKPVQALKINTRELSAPSASSASAESSPILSPLSAVQPKESHGRSPVGNKAAAFAPTPARPNPEEDTIPTIEVSIARSVSVSRGKKQVIVPVRPRADRLNPDERLVVRQAKTPKVTGGQHGHRPGISQDARIESV